jgi:hypothetical protein
MEQIWCVSRCKVESGQGGRVKSSTSWLSSCVSAPKLSHGMVAAAADEDKRLGAKVHTRDLIYKFGEKISYYSAQSVQRARRVPH